MEVWWTPTQRIRTAGELALELALQETKAGPMYQRVARKVLHLRELGLSYCAIARRLEIDDKTVAKAVRWLEGIRS